MKHFRLIKKNIDVSEFLTEVARSEEYWDTMRAMNNSVQRETLNISLRAVAPLISVRVEDNHIHHRSPFYDRFPSLTNFIEDFSRDADGELSRAMIVSLQPKGKVYEHVDVGEYYRFRDRYHLVLQSDGSWMRSGDEEQIFKAGELWWFDNKASHSSHNPSDIPRIHLIFDILPEANRPLVEALVDKSIRT